MPVDKSEQRIRDLFTSIAGRYDFNNHFLSAGTDIYWRNRAIAAVEPRVAGPLLDVCTGTGDVAIALAKKFGPEREVVGSDFTPAMLQIAREKAAKVNGSGPTIPFIEADTQQLPFPDDNFAAVTVAFGLRNVTDTDRGLAEMTRVAKPGGQVLVLEFSMPTAPVLGTAYRTYFTKVLPAVGQLVARNKESAYNYLPESVGEFPNGQALAARFEAAGLVDVDFTPLTLGVATIYRGRKPA
ncbi:MAG: bifunctional demethylmenaquinone methyltransferase/2-methoxy-6-polyprenyl-1,4-benzoquinol methylase UbiE [Planctomycetota bacterium]